MRLTDLLAADGACALRVSDTLGDLYDFGAVDRTRARLGGLLQRLEQRNRGFVDERYALGAGRTVPAAMQRLIDGGGRSMLLYVAGSAGPRGGLVVRARPVGGPRVRTPGFTATRPGTAAAPPARRRPAAGPDARARRGSGSGSGPRHADGHRRHPPLHAGRGLER